MGRCHESEQCSSLCFCICPSHAHWPSHMQVHSMHNLPSHRGCPNIYVHVLPSGLGDLQPLMHMHSAREDDAAAHKACCREQRCKPGMPARAYSLHHAEDVHTTGIAPIAACLVTSYKRLSCSRTSLLTAHDTGSSGVHAWSSVPSSSPCWMLLLQLQQLLLLPGR